MYTIHLHVFQFYYKNLHLLKKRDIKKFEGICYALVTLSYYN